MFVKILKAAVACIALTISSFTYAGLIEYTISGNGSGTLGSNTFDNQDFTFQLFADTNNYSGNKFSSLERVNLTVDGLGDTDFISATRLGYAPVSDVVFFSSNFGRGLDLFDFRLANSIDLVASFPTQLSVSVFALEQFNNIQTTLGLLSFDSSSQVTFSTSLTGSIVTPTPMPEPSTLAVLCLGFVGLISRKLLK